MNVKKILKIIGNIIIAAFIATLLAFLAGFKWHKIPDMPIVIETACEPQIDTLVTQLPDGQQDTTFIYTFFNIVIE